MLFEVQFMRLFPEVMGKYDLFIVTVSIVLEVLRSVQQRQLKPHRSVLVLLSGLLIS